VSSSSPLCRPPQPDSPEARTAVAELLFEEVLHEELRRYRLTYRGTPLEEALTDDALLEALRTLFLAAAPETLGEARELFRESVACLETLELDRNLELDQGDVPDEAGRTDVVHGPDADPAPALPGDTPAGNVRCFDLELGGDLDPSVSPSRCPNAVAAAPEVWAPNVRREVTIADATP
jgi:hypothetical protein